MSDIIGRCMKWYRSTGAPTYKAAADAIEERDAIIADYEMLQVCDCCEGLFESVDDAGGHMQCKQCSEIARLRERLRNHTCDFTDCKALRRERHLRAALEQIAKGCDMSNEAQAIAREALNHEND